MAVSILSLASLMAVVVAALALTLLFMLRNSGRRAE
jgi:hypothetical protein